ncbi:MAG: chromosome segregation protein SMC [Candidatus Omnitrophica bacterium]|nr:chromosome segregation protein SMC [Candidatus Omnitrophota bacterium]
MHFKKLEIVGFKSFAEKTTLYFEPGITAVVGPNGCGKSNIIDAIKWVLGEQSIKSLRGSKMEDVIFNGTEEREPINMAEVSLTLVNKDRTLPIDSNEVVVSRRLFRSGESEYLLNKTPVRLKDINDVFIGTGMGASMYSIIEQGKIGMILSSKPEDRRYIFEEASGITKFKAKKKEAMRKLEATDANLLRLSDIIAEVKRQIDSITRQARKAERYKQRFDRLKEIEIQLASFEYGHLKREINEINEQSAKIKDETRALSSQIEELRLKLDSDKSALTEIDERFSGLQNSKFSKESQIGQGRSKISVNKERIVELSVRLKDLRDEIQALEIRKESSQKLVQEIEEKFQAVSDSEDAKKVVLKEEETKLGRLESDMRLSEKLIEESKEKIVDFMSERSKSRNEVIRLTSDIQNRSARLRRLALELEKVNGEAEAVRQKLEENRREFEQVEARLNKIRQESGRLNQEKNGVLASLESAQKALEEEKNSLIALESKKSFLEDLIARHEGFAAGVKALLDSRGGGGLQMDGIKGALGNMITVEKGYEYAVEAVLGDRVQCVVSQDRQSALRAGEYLSANQHGRATFLILDELLAGGQNTDEVLPPGGITGSLVNFVNADSELKQVLTNMLSDVYLIENIEMSADILTMNAARPMKLVTKRGEIASRGFITAGQTAKGEDTGIIGRERRLRETIDGIEALKVKIDGSEAQRNDQKMILRELEGKLTSVGELLKEEEFEYHKKESELVIIEESSKKLGEEMSLLNLEKDEVDEEIRDSSQRKEALEERLKEIDAGESNTQNVLLSSQGQVKNFAKEREEVVVLIAEIRTEIQALSKERLSLSQNLDLQRESFRTYSVSLDQKTDEIDNSIKKSEELAQEIEELEAESVKLSDELQAVSAELSEIRVRKSESSTLIKDCESRLGEFYKIVNERKDAGHTFQMKNSETGFKLETLKNRMSQLYKIDMDVYTARLDPAADWDAVRREIEELNRKLESMGTVNLVAIEEHKELEDRFNFLSDQREDLNKAKDDLQKAITKINKTTRKLFIETFEKIQVEFKNYFRYLFGGGQAEVFLMDEHDVLESGIEIVARPPGKKLQNISLLSGGEKALTAIALIFAIFKVKPSPFCLLDEVDAPLDESNIVRFSKALIDFTKKSQFIVITHNKRTITLADVMYGITMQKSGVSKIVSVKFHDDGKSGETPPEKPQESPSEEPQEVK